MLNGKLCQRMDRFKCPFHGKIIARDVETGKALNEDEEKSVQEQLRKKDKNNSKKNKKEICMPEFDDPTLIRDIEAATGQNLSLTKQKNGSKCKRLGGNLTKIHNSGSKNSRKRLENRILSTKTQQKVGNILDNIEYRLNKEKFHHNFNYSINS
jgi:UV-stimulated scaffold protein A